MNASLNASSFRTSRNYELVLFDRLEPEVRELLADLEKDPELYGVLRPRDDSGRTLKAVNRETALLLLTLQQAGPLPAYVLEGGRGDATDVTRLVMDGILEMQRGDEFVTGASALELLDGPPERGCGDSLLARLSSEALRYGAALEVDRPDALSMRLYSFNRQPLTPRWDRRFPDGDAVLSHLGLEPGGALSSRLGLTWAGPAKDGGDWLSWTRRDRRSESGSKKPVYKLYVSARVEALGRVMTALVGVLAKCPAIGFKVGGNAAGLLRPDKLVVYFTRFDDLAGTASRLADGLAGLEPHGVPFSAEVAGNGLLSWGMDPPRHQQALSWQQPESWRLWITNRLAAAILDGRRSGAHGDKAWRFALERLHLEGIDVDRWTPSLSAWRARPTASAASTGG